MAEVFQYADDIGPVKIFHVYEPAIGLKGILVVDNVARGPSIGGVRIAPDVSERRRIPVEGYLKKQGWFAHLFKPQRNEALLEELQAKIDEYWECIESTDLRKSL